MPLRTRSHWFGVVLDCPDASELAHFYERLLGWKVFKDTPEWATLAPSESCWLQPRLPAGAELRAAGVAEPAGAADHDVAPRPRGRRPRAGDGICRGGRRRARRRSSPSRTCASCSTPQATRSASTSTRARGTGSTSPPDRSRSHVVREPGCRERVDGTEWLAWAPRSRLARRRGCCSRAPVTWRPCRPRRSGPVWHWAMPACDSSTWAGRPTCVAICSTPPARRRALGCWACATSRRAASSCAPCGSSSATCRRSTSCRAGASSSATGTSRTSSCGRSDLTASAGSSTVSG